MSGTARRVDDTISGSGTLSARRVGECFGHVGMIQTAATACNYKATKSTFGRYQSMSYAFLTIKREEDGRQTVYRPRVTDVIGYALRGAFDEPNGTPSDFAELLHRLDAIPSRLH
ncbi:hypothetical protein C8J44_3434 [Sphingomonas sp. PP-CE-3A-406]|nr:hypothetical protein C8J44_3434 [Sphingomonas sp. PP-CE-3A-406]